MAGVTRVSAARTRPSLPRVDLPGRGISQPRGARGFVCSTIRDRLDRLDYMAWHTTRLVCYVLHNPAMLGPSHPTATQRYGILAMMKRP